MKSRSTFAGLGAAWLCLSVAQAQTTPEVSAADRFLAEIAKPANEPAFIHCGGGGRAATMWFIKRMVVDKWDVDRASAEATALGMNNATLKQWAIDYAKSKAR